MDGQSVVLVTGAAGFLGRHVCARLRQSHIPFHGIDQRSAAQDPEVQTCDIADANAVVSVFSKYPIGAVIHLAAVLQSIARINPSLATRVNVLGSLNLLELAVQNRVKRFVFASSMSVYGSFGSHHVFTEKDPTGPIDLYGTAKRYVEIFGELLASRKALEFVALRIAGIVGAGSGSTTSPWRSEIFENLSPRSIKRTIVLPFVSDSVLSLVHVEDVAEMLLMLTRAPSIPSLLYNSPAENWPATELRDKLQSIGKNITVDGPGFAGKLAPALSDGSLFERDFQYVLPSLERRFVRAAAS